MKRLVTAAGAVWVLAAAATAPDWWDEMAALFILIWLAERHLERHPERKGWRPWD